MVSQRKVQGLFENEVQRGKTKGKMKQVEYNSQTCMKLSQGEDREAGWLPGWQGWTSLCAWPHRASCSLVLLHLGWVCSTSVAWEGCLLRKACAGHGGTAHAQHEELAGDDKLLWDPQNEGRT